MNNEEYIVKHDFKIKTFNDVYRAVGIIIQLSQDLECDYRQFVKLTGVEIEKLDSATLSRINCELYKQKKISKKDFDNLQMVIQERNYVNHEFFSDKSFGNNLSLMNERLNMVYNYICEACDVIANLIAKTTGDPVIRPTIFDTQ